MLDDGGKDGGGGGGGSESAVIRRRRRLHKISILGVEEAEAEDEEGKKTQIEKNRDDEDARRDQHDSWCSASDVYDQTMYCTNRRGAERHGL